MGPAGRGRDVAPARTRCAPSFPGTGTLPQRPADPLPSRPRPPGARTAAIESVRASGLGLWLRRRGGVVALSLPSGRRYRACVPAEVTSNLPSPPCPQLARGPLPGPPRPSASPCEKENWGPEWAVGAAPAAAILQVWLATYLSGGSASRVVRFRAGVGGWMTPAVGCSVCTEVQCLQ